MGIDTSVIRHFYMKIKGTSIIEIEIDKNEEKRITMKNLRDLVGWESFHWVDLNTDKLMKSKSYNSSHSWSEDIPLRNATDIEIAIQKIINFLRLKV
jgi:hypothetical protein